MRLRFGRETQKNEGFCQSIMNVAFLHPNQSVEQVIVEEISQWTTEVLSKPSVNFNDLPPCPYAKQALADGKVAIIFNYDKNYQTLYSTVSQFDDNFDLAIIVDLSQYKEAEAFHEYLDEMNTAISRGWFIDKDVWVMGFHPDDDEADFAEEAEVEPLTDVEYALIFVQRLSKLQQAADKLDKKGYYDMYEAECNVKQIYARREELYWRLQDGNES